MNIVFGIDVSSRSSNVCILFDDNKQEFKITNDTPGFYTLLKNLEVFAKHPQIIFESTGVYSRRLEAFLEAYHYDYVVINPLKAKKEMDTSLRHNKNDRVDAYKLAKIQLLHHHQFLKRESQIYKDMRSLDRFYEELTADIVKTKNRLHRILQLTFPDLENIVSTASGKNYWNLVKLYPHCQDVRDLNISDIVKTIEAFKGYGTKRSQKVAIKLKELAKTAYPACKQYGPERDAVIYYTDCLLALDEKRNKISGQMLEIAKNLDNRDLAILTSIPGFAETTAVRVLAELGNIRRFDNPNKIDAFIGIDPGRYQSGEKDASLCISKHGNAIARKILYRSIGQIDQAAKFASCHIAEYYENKKSSQTKGFKKIAIASVHKLIRTIYALIKNDQLYDYKIAKQNQRHKM